MANSRLGDGCAEENLWPHLRQLITSAARDPVTLALTGKWPGNARTQTLSLAGLVRLSPLTFATRRRKRASAGGYGPRPPADGISHNWV